MLFALSIGCIDDEPAERGALQAARALHDAQTIRLRADAASGDLASAPSDRDPSGLPTAGDRPGPMARSYDDFGAAGFQVEPLDVPVLSDHVVAVDPDDDFGSGYGGGFADIDGDGDDDLFLGTSGPEGGAMACLYENRSIPGSLRFEPIDGLCGPELATVRSAAGVDFDGDDVDELLLLGPNRIDLLRFRPERTTTDLFAVAASVFEDGRRVCNVGTLLATDLDYDGRLDLIVGCHVSNVAARSGDPNIVLRQREDGGFEPLVLPRYAPLRDSGITLALSAHDVDDDGLLDIVVANDTFSTVGQRNTFLRQGRLYHACDPTRAGCRFEGVNFAPDVTAWGAFMGIGVLHSERYGELIYLSDRGPNRAVAFTEDGPVEYADELEIAIGRDGEDLLYAWGVIVDDLDRNGTDDLIVTHGSIVLSEIYPGHRDYALFQTPEGNFVSAGPQAGLLREELGPDGPSATDFYGRGAARMDLDRDGAMEILVVGLAGAPRIYGERARDGQPPRCTLVPRSRYVPTWGYGVGVRGDGDRHFRYADVQGQFNLGLSDELLAVRGTGVVRFASGAVARYACDDTPGPVEVVEPPWLSVRADRGDVVVDVDPSAWGYRREGAMIRAAIRDGDGGTSVIPLGPLSARSFRVDAPDAEAVMLQIDARWIARWFEVE